MTVTTRSSTLNSIRSILRQLKSETSLNPLTTSNGADSIGNKFDISTNFMAQCKIEQKASPNRARLLCKMVKDLDILNKELKERAGLYELDGGAENKLSPKELSRRAAARAGLELPETYNDQ
mmetsp:Transcript_15866/g.22597  ORF Transcript_15866/g.22597 Transcript_15866/m.22597 type:complete len:122 (-) Transcript_15866:80-445(-)